MDRKGFSLNEPLAVVAIIDILATVGIVAYIGYTVSAKIYWTKQNYKTKCQNILIAKHFLMNS